MKRLATALLISLILSACGGREKPVQAPLDHATFSRVLAGALLMEARRGEEVRIPVQQAPDLSGYRELFDREGVSQDDFKATYEAYLQQPERLKEVYQDALEQLQWQADSLQQAAPVDTAS